MNKNQTKQYNASKYAVQDALQSINVCPISKRWSAEQSLVKPWKNFGICMYISGEVTMGVYKYIHEKGGTRSTALAL